MVVGVNAYREICTLHLAGQILVVLYHSFHSLTARTVCDASFSVGQDGGGGERVPGDLYAAPGRPDPRGQEAGAAPLPRRRWQGQEDRRQNQGSVVDPH